MAEPLIYVSSEELARRLCCLFEKNCSVCCVASTPSEAIMLLAENEDKNMVAVLDTYLPWRNTAAVLAEIEERNVPTLYLSQQPISMGHMKALCNVPSESLASPQREEEVLDAFRRLENGVETRTVGDVVLNCRQHCVSCPNGEYVLTNQEFELLRVLMENCDTPLSRSQLLRSAWGFIYPGETRTVDVHIQRLRAKIGREFIETVRGKGYMVPRVCSVTL